MKAIHVGYIFLACKKLAKHNLYPDEILYNGTFPKNFGYSKYQGDLQVLKKAPEQILNCSRAIIIVYQIYVWVFCYQNQQNLFKCS